MSHADDIWIANELAHVFVIRHDDRLHLLFGNLLRERADHVVGFISGIVDRGNVEHFAEPENVRHLLGEIVRHLEPVCLVVGKRLVSKSLLA